MTAHTATSDQAREIVYAPDLDGAADPGEVVWTWVEFEEDASQGKDRPVLVVGRDAADLLGLMLSSKPHDGDQDWVGIGAGPWDSQGRESYLRLDRTLVIAEHEIRREGAILPRAAFGIIAARLRSNYGWR